MRITFVLPPAGLSGGIRVVAIYGERLQRRGHRVLFVSPPRRLPTLRESVRDLVRGRGWPKKPKGRGASHLDAVPVEHRVLDRFRPVTDADVPDGDLVVATWWETAEWVAGLSPTKGRPVYLLQHDESGIQGQPVERVKATWRLPFRKVVVAQWLADLAAQEYGDADVDVVPNAVDLEHFSAPPRGKQSAPTVGMMFSRQPWKGTDVMLAAVEQLRQAMPGVRVVAFGMADAAELNLPAWIDYHLKPAQPAIPKLYASCDAWLFASRFEGFGLPILEAMACRTPVVATPAGAAPELMNAGGGVLVPMEDAGAMMRAAKTILESDETAWRELSDRAYAAAAGYTWDDATDRLEEVFERVTRARSAGVPQTPKTSRTLTAPPAIDA